MSFFELCLFAFAIFIFAPISGSSRGHLKFLTEDTWGEMLEGEWMIEFFAPWCPACRQLEPIWQEFAGWSDDLGIRVGAVDVTFNPGLSGRFAITALPTIFHVKGGIFRQYRGSKRKEDLISFIEDVKWKDIDPIPSWKSPDSFQMSSLAYFFKLSMFLRNIHNDIVEFGIPYWGSYVIFGVATILLGAVLGLIIVCIIDYICPTKRPAQRHLEEQPLIKEISSDNEQKETAENFDVQASEDSNSDDTNDEEDEQSGENLWEKKVRRRGKHSASEDGGCK